MDVPLAALLGLVVVLSCVGGSSASAPSAPRQPSVVVVLTDDEPALDGRLMAFMPHARSIFRDHGLTFVDFHGETPLCCPARAGFLTGQHTHNHGVTKNSASRFDPRVSLATALRAAGYHTVLVGKYMNGYGGCNGINCALNVPPGWDRWAAFGSAYYYDYDLWIDGRREYHGWDEEDYSTDVVAEKAAELIAQAPSGKPLFAWISVFAPHEPYMPAPRHANEPCNVPPWSPPNWNEADVSDKPEYVRSLPPLPGTSTSVQAHCRTLLAVDDLIGRVRGALAKRGWLADTVFVYTSDNGMHMGEHRLLKKSAPYQARIPFYLSWPAKRGTRPKRISERLENIDFAPTVCELAGCTIGPYPNGQTKPDGVSFAGLLSHPSGTLTREAVLGELPVAYKWTPAWHSITTTGASPLRFEGCAQAPEGGCRWHYIEYRTGEKELYDLSNGPCWTWQVGDEGDPCKLDNAVGRPEYENLVTELDALLKALKRESGRA